MKELINERLGGCSQRNGAVIPTRTATAVDLTAATLYGAKLNKAMCSVQCAVCKVYCVVCSVQFSVCSVQYAVSSV